MLGLQGSRLVLFRSRRGVDGSSEFGALWEIMALASGPGCRSIFPNKLAEGEPPLPEIKASLGF